jgi:hypothetical protein
MERPLCISVWDEPDFKRSGPLIIENDKELYCFIRYDENHGKTVDPVCIGGKDADYLMVPPDYAYPIVIAKNKNRLIPDGPMEHATLFNETYKELTKGTELTIPEIVKSYWDDLSTRVLKHRGLKGKSLLNALSKDVPELVVHDPTHYPADQEPLACVLYHQAREMHTMIRAVIPGCIPSLPEYRHSAVDEATTTMLTHELEILFKSYQAADVQDGVGVAAIALPCHKLFADYADLTDQFMPVVLGRKTWSGSHDAFAYGMSASHWGWMYEAAKNKLEIGGLLIADGHYKYDIPHIHVVQENPSSRTFQRRGVCDPTKYFTDVGHFPGLHMTVYGRKPDLSGMPV